MTRFAFTADSTNSGTGSLSVGNFLDDVAFGTPPCLTIDKSVSPTAPANPGDVLTYHLAVKNTGGADAENVVLSDTIPAGTTYVPGSLAVTAGPGTGAVSDPVDGDRGEVVGTALTVRLGNGVTASGGTLPNTDTVPETDVSFQVQVDGTAATVSNTASATYETTLPGGPSTFSATSNTADSPVNPPTTTSTTTSTSTSTTSTTSTDVDHHDRGAPDHHDHPAGVPVGHDRRPVPAPPEADDVHRSAIASDPDPATAAASAGPGSLASTGSDSRSPVGIAFAAIGLGLMILAVRGRRLLG